MSLKEVDNNNSSSNNGNNSNRNIMRLRSIAYAYVPDESDLGCILMGKFCESVCEVAVSVYLYFVSD
jgi:hypothetical protein